MKNLKVKLFTLALLAGLGSALATTPHRDLDNKKWARDPMSGQYVDITGEQLGEDYQCISSSSVCTAEYPEDVDPNDQANDAHPGTAAAQNVVTGTFQ